MFKDGVGSAKTGETASDDDDLVCHGYVICKDVRRKGGKERRGGECEGTEEREEEEEGRGRSVPLLKGPLLIFIRAVKDRETDNRHTRTHKSTRTRASECKRDLHI